MIAPAFPAPRTMRWVPWLAFVALCTGVTVLGSLAAGEPATYARLAKPWWAPPAWVLVPIWATVSTLTGTASYVVWSQTTETLRHRALSLFGVQLALHVLWAFCFGQGLLGAAFLLILAYWFTVAAVVSVYGLLVPLAGWLVAPLWIWITFSTGLGATIWWLAR